MKWFREKEQLTHNRLLAIFTLERNRDPTEVYTCTACSPQITPRKMLVKSLNSSETKIFNKPPRRDMNVSKGANIIAAGFLWSTVTISHRSTGMLPRSQLTLLDRRGDQQLTQSQPNPDHFQPLPRDKSGIWDRQSSRNDWNLLAGLMRWTDFRLPLPSFVFQCKEHR